MKITIARKFQKLTPGNDCNGREITGPEGERLGRISREVTWINVPGSLSSGCVTGKVTGYVLELFGEDAPADRTFPTLSECTSAARKAFATPRTRKAPKASPVAPKAPEATSTPKAPKVKPIAPCNGTQAAALLAFAAEHGEGWKAILTAGWLRAAFPGALQQVRNGHGPAWLARVTIEALQVMASPVAPEAPAGEIPASAQGYGADPGIVAPKAPEACPIVPAPLHPSCDHGPRTIATCGICTRSWCDACDPTPAAMCPWCHGRGHSSAPRNPEAPEAPKAPKVCARCGEARECFALGGCTSPALYPCVPHTRETTQATPEAFAREHFVFVRIGDKPKASPAPEAPKALRLPSYGDPTPTHDRPLADPGLTSYRCRNRYGWTMIGARNHAEAMREALRSWEGSREADLQIWNGQTYVNVNPEASPEAPRAPIAFTSHGTRKA